MPNTQDTNAVILEAAREALRSQHWRPNDGAELEGEAAIAAQHLAVVDGAVRVVDEQGRVRERFSAGAPGNGMVPMSVADLLTELIYYRALPNRAR